MARKKVEEEQNIPYSDITEENVPDVTEEPETEANANATETEEKTGVFVILRKGASFSIGDYTFIKNTPAPVDSKKAEKLMATGFFERAD